MPSKVFYLNEQQQEAISIKWGMFWRNFTIHKDGQLIAQLSGSNELERGDTFILPDGRSLRVQLTRKYVFNQGLDVLVDGQLLAGSHTHPQQQFKQGLQALAFLIVVNVGCGLLALLAKVEMLQEMGIGAGNVLMGVLYAGLAYWAKTKTSAVALYIALALFVLDFVLALFLASEQRITPTGGMLLRIILGVFLYSGAQGASGLRKQLAAATDNE